MAMTGVVDAGRELDALVAEKVMGWTPRGTRTRYDGLTTPTFEEGPWGEDEENPPEFSTDIAAAWQVVDRMLELGMYVEMIALSGEWGVMFSEGQGIGGWQYLAPSASEAICLAALAAVSRSATSSVAALPADQD